MTVTQKPLGHTTINGHTVRFYPSPLPGPDYPWHVMGDLMDALELPDHWQRSAIDKFTQAWPEHCRTIAVADSTLAIGSSLCGLGLLEWLSAENGRKIAEERDAFMDAMSLGLARQMKHLPPAEFETICQIAAARHSQGAGSA
jgi:hypothetical protein